MRTKEKLELLREIAVQVDNLVSRMEHFSPLLELLDQVGKLVELNKKWREMEKDMSVPYA